jgi:hypothetical protein
VAARADVCACIGKIVRLTREMDKVLMGASSRAAVHLLQAAKVRALMSGRAFVSGVFYRMAAGNVDGPPPPATVEQHAIRVATALMLVGGLLTVTGALAAYLLGRSGPRGPEQ